MTTTPQFCFTHSSGEDIYLFALHNNRGTKVLISNYGAIITSFTVQQADGTGNDIMLGFDRVEDYLQPAYLENYPWFGAAIGRYGNRIRNARFTIDGTEYRLSTNNGHDQLHGGKEGFDKKAWKPAAVTSSSLLLTYVSSDGEEGFPGRLDVQLYVELNDNNELGYEYRAVTSKPTAVNLTHHGYFNLHTQKDSIAGHELLIPASHILEQDSDLLTTGRLLDVTGTAHDFRTWKKINAGDDYDQTFIPGKQSTELTRIAAARSPQSLLEMEVWTTEPAVHFYTGRWIPSIQGKNGTWYGPHSGFCLETQVHPNAINIPHFPDTVLRPGETYRTKTVYKIIAGT